jgi:hypothetical protein
VARKEIKPKETEARAGGAEARGKAKAGSAAAAEMGTGNIVQIREILFGSQMRDYEKRFGRLEARLSSEAAVLRDDIKKRLDTLEGYVKKEIESLNTDLKNEQEARAKALAALAAEVKSATGGLEQSVTQLDERFNAAARELRQQLLDQSKTLADDIGRNHQQLSSLVDDTTEEIKAEKVDRRTLADLFAELSVRLTDGQSMQSILESVDLEHE